MKRRVVLVCGGRDYKDRATVARALDALHGEQPISLLVHGAARGADSLAERWAFERQVHVAAVPALWGAFGYGAGPRRNAAMLELQPDVVLAFPGGNGTANMVALATAAGIPVVRAVGHDGA